LRQSASLLDAPAVAPSLNRAAQSSGAIEPRLYQQTPCQLASW
jgi:hypothetical protein